MVPDPYKALGLTHSATEREIKLSYRKLALRLHPDRLMSRGASKEEIEASSYIFVRVTSAYSLLSDPSSKRKYDHIYKFGGYSKEQDEKQQTHPRPPRASSSPAFVKKGKKGIGYKFTNPVDYVLSQGKVKSTTVAGVNIPSRFGIGSNRSFQLSVSSGKAEESPSGSIHCRSTTMKFVGGKKHNKVETTHIDRTGRRETIIQGEDFVERNIAKVTPRRKPRLESVNENDEGHANVGHGSGCQFPWLEKVSIVYRVISSNVRKCTSAELF